LGTFRWARLVHLGRPAVGELPFVAHHALASLPVVSPQKLRYSTVAMPQEGHMAESKLDLLQGTLDLMVLRTLAALGSLHGYGIARRIEQVSGDKVLLNQGTI